VTSTAPAHVDLASRVQRSKDPAQGAMSNRVDMTSLNRGDELLRHNCSGRQVHLAPAAATAQGADDQPDPSIVHRTMIGGAAYQSRTA
jgi:hypothetical protein